MTDNTDPSQPTRSLFGRKPDHIQSWAERTPDRIARESAATEFMTDSTAPPNVLAGLRARHAAKSRANTVVQSALRMLMGAGSPTPLQTNTAAAAEQPGVTTAVDSDTNAPKAPRIPRLVRDLAAGKSVSLAGAAGPPFRSDDRLCLSARDLRIFWLLARYGFIAVSDLAIHFGGRTTTQTLQLRGNKLERAGLIVRHDFPGRSVVWVPTRFGLFVSGVARPPAVSFKSEDALQTLVAAHCGLSFERSGYRVASRQELLAGRYFQAPATSRFAAESLDLALGTQLVVGPGLAHCPDLVLRSYFESGRVSEPVGVDVELGLTSDRAWEAVVDGFRLARPFRGILFVTPHRLSAREIDAFLLEQGVADWAQLLGFGAPRYLR